MGYTGGIRQRAKTAQSNNATTNAEKSDAQGENNNTFQQRSSFPKMLIPKEHRMNVLLGSLVFANLIIFSSKLKSGNFRITLEPLPTTEKINQIISEWDKTVTKADTMRQPLPGPIPKHLFISPCMAHSPQDICQANIDNIIKIYSKHSSKTSFSPVTYLDSETCIPIIQNVEPKLVDPFKYENMEINKSIICRIAALNLYGGYYIQNEMEVVVPVIPPDDVTFSTAIEEPGNGFFEAFLAATPHHPIMDHTLKNMVEHYEKALIRPKESQDFAPDNTPFIDSTYREKLQESDPGWNFGTRTLKDAFASLPEAARGKTMLVQEIHLNDEHKEWYPEFERRVSDKCCCNFVVHDPRTKTVHFWSRIVGSTFC